MTALTLGGEELDVALDGGAGAFTAVIEETTLALTPVEGGEAWTLNGYALKTLAASGIENVQLALDGDATVELPTQPALSGSAYAALCAAGRVSHDYTYTVRADGIGVSVSGAEYQLSPDGELIQTEGNEDA